jgi:predicted acetyltransferase
VLVSFLSLSACGVLVLFLCPLRHDGALSSLSSFSGISRGDLFWLLSPCFVRCGVGRGVARRACCVAAGGGTAGVLSWLHRAASAWLICVGCVFVLQCSRVCVSFFFPSRHDGTLPSVAFLSCFSRGDLFRLNLRHFVRCGVGRGVAWRLWCLAAGRGTAGISVLVASCSVCVAYKCWLCYCLSVLVGRLLLSSSALCVTMVPFLPSSSGFSRGDLFWLLPRCFVRCGVGRGVARRAWCVVAGGGTAGILAWLHRAASAWLMSVGCVFVFLCLWVFVYVSARRVMMAPFLLFHL